jgi:hypothetical protein
MVEFPGYATSTSTTSNMDAASAVPAACSVGCRVMCRWMKRRVVCRYGMRLKMRRRLGRFDRHALLVDVRKLRPLGRVLRQHAFEQAQHGAVTGHFWPFHLYTHTHIYLDILGGGGARQRERERERAESERERARVFVRPGLGREWTQV